ncbi:MAG: hypothetical protein GC158_06905 [Cyanobacteria bacterium RI_101]|nr:hypothetical protein [Cyanobacteria bacterium RI_101]
MILICLANSYKHQGRCLAGIDPQSGRWVRPFSPSPDGTIPLDDPLIKVDHIELLDLVDIPLNSQNIRGYEEENQGYYPASWQVLGKAKITALLKYRDHQLLYPQFDCFIPFADLKAQKLRNDKIKTLQLIEVKSFYAYRTPWGKYRGKIKDNRYGLEKCELSITDPFFREKLAQNQPVSRHCLLCMSLGQPWQAEPGMESRCYRLIAGVIELLPEIEQIQTALERAGWDQDQGRRYLQEQFNKSSRYELTALEAQAFLKILGGETPL